MGCEKLRHLQVGDNAKYTSQRMIQEFLSVMGEQIEYGQLEGLCSSQFFAIMIDESTDIAILKEMVIYAWYVTPKAEICITFLNILPLRDGTAETIEEAVIAYLESKSISISHLVGFGSDGASVMTGRHGGVAARLKHRQPCLLASTVLLTAWLLLQVSPEKA